MISQPRERTGILCLEADQLLAIEMQDPLTKERFWSFPGGELEADETPAEGAVRETLEETGYRVRVTSDVFTNRYDFRWNGKVYACTTHWFTATLESGLAAPVDDAAYILGSAWLQWPDCRERFLFNEGLVSALDYFLPAAG